MNNYSSVEDRGDRPRISKGILIARRIVIALMIVLITLLLVAIFNGADPTNTSELELRNVVTEFGSNANNPANAAASKISFNAKDHERERSERSQSPAAP